MGRELDVDAMIKQLLDVKKTEKQVKANVLFHSK